MHGLEFVKLFVIHCDLRLLEPAKRSSHVVFRGEEREKLVDDWVFQDIFATKQDHKCFKEDILLFFDELTGQVIRD